ncbi:MAG TPA: thiamine-phosphate kinase [Methyloceanibacter sp.]|jgi:thiamine-monophosphate kinase|nr:thiamine-phosphate kinase [Methyloceanibacter sp.]
MAKSDRHVEGGRLGEFELIARYFAPLATDAAALSLRDDAAVIRPPESQEIVLSCDTVIEGVHFLPGGPPDLIAHKALAVNLSDLAAKGARPYVYLLALALPAEPSAEWLEAFASGLRQLQREAGICLVGGDTSRIPGPLTITITALGLVPQGHAVLRHGAKPGDRIYVSGTIGDACLGLRLLKDASLAQVWDLSDEDVAFLIDRYRRPEPRGNLALAVRNFAQGAIDVSDGLVGDIEKLAQVSHVGAVIETARVPLSAAAQKALKHEPKLLGTLLASGDDYEIVAAVPEASASAFENAAAAKGTAIAMIGRIDAQAGEVRVLAVDGKPLTLTRSGFSHF